VLGALATGFVTLLLSRAVVGLGCAACVPVANALICDVFPEEGKAQRISLFNLGLFLGGVVGIGAGGIFGFPSSLVIVGLPGLALAYLVATLDLPDQRSGAGDASRMSVRAFARDLASAFRVRTLRWMFIAAILMAFAAGGYLGWFVDFLTRAKGMTEGEATVFFAVLLVGGLTGVLCGGIVGDRLCATRPHGRQLAVVIAFACAVPCALIAIYAPRGPVFYVSALSLLFFSMWYHGPIAAAVDDLVPSETAATSQGVYIFLMHLLGTAPSAWAVGWLVDRVGLEHALLLPTGCMALAAVGFGISCRSVADDLAQRR
jgi:predicted MFS family arabinose efflux permease